MNAAGTFGPIVIVEIMYEEDFMEILDLHEFHFIMDSNMKGELKDLKAYKEVGSLSGVIVKILLLLIPVLEREHKWGEQRFSKYRLVNEDPEIERTSVHAYMPDSMYRRLKLMHSDLNFYSIAQLTRGLLLFFLDLVKEYGDGVYNELRNIFKNWKMVDEKNKLTPWKFIRQLVKILQHLPAQNRLVNIYGGQFSPFWIFRL